MEKFNEKHIRKFVKSTNEEGKREFAKWYMENEPMMVIPFYQKGDAMEMLQLKDKIREYFPHPYFIYFSQAQKDGTWEHYPLI